MKKPLVSICCITYNHAPFIRQCLDGFLMQQLNLEALPFREEYEVGYEILIHDDCSTDGPAEIIKEYAAKYPDIIKPLYETENQYSKGVWVDGYNYRRAQGKYIAYCEGDDYWTDPLKLQKQVVFMENHPDYSVCFHNFKCYIVDKHQFVDAIYQNPQTMIGRGVDVTPYMFFHRSYGGQPLTMLFRKSMFSFEWHKQYAGYRDTHEIYHLLRTGKGRYIDFIGGVYVQHSGGISTSVTTLQSCREEREHILDLFLHNKDDKMLADYLKDILLWNYDSYKRDGKIWMLLRIWWKYMKIVPKISLKVLYVILKRLVKQLTKKSFHNTIFKLWQKWIRLRLQPIRVFVFHQVSAVFDPKTMWQCDWTEIEQFKRNILKLRSEYEFISLPTAYEKLNKDLFRHKKYAVLTCDDGWASLKGIVPWLMDMSVPLTLFLNPCYLDGQHYQERETEKLLSMHDVNEWIMKYGDKLSIASHGWDHTDCSSQDKEVFRQNVDNTIQYLYNEYAYVPFFAYPCGRHLVWQDEYLLNKNIIPVYCDGQKNYNNKKIIHRECIDYETLRNHPVL